MPVRCLAQDSAHVNVLCLSLLFLRLYPLMMVVHQRRTLLRKLLVCRSSNNSVTGNSDIFLIIYSKPGCHLCDGLKVCRDIWRCTRVYSIDAGMCLERRACTHRSLLTNCSSTSVQSRFSGCKQAFYVPHACNIFRRLCMVFTFAILLLHNLSHITASLKFLRPETLSCPDNNLGALTINQ